MEGITKMKTKLNILERFLVLNILPKENNIMTLKTIRKLQDTLLPSDEELDEIEMKIITEDSNGNPLPQPQNQFNKKKAEVEKEFEIAERGHDIISDALNKLDKEKKLNLEHMSLWDKFMEENKDD